MCGKYPITRNLEGIIVSHPALHNYYNPQKNLKDFACIIIFLMHHELRHMQNLEKTAKTFGNMITKSDCFNLNIRTMNFE